MNSGGVEDSRTSRVLHSNGLFNAIGKSYILVSKSNVIQIVNVRSVVNERSRKFNIIIVYCIAVSCTSGSKI